MKDKCLVVTFAQGEKTKDFSIYCMKKLGFNNHIILEDESGFDKKFLDFAKIASESNFEIFIRNDADRLCFQGLSDLFDIACKDPDLVWATGAFYDNLMSARRIGTPTVHKKPPLIHLNKNQHLMKSVQKPESTFATSIKPMFKMREFDILTNLHDYLQYPSKVCNTLVNRFYRGHWGYLYNMNKLRSIPTLSAAVSCAEKYVSKNPNKPNMDYVDFSHLDSNEDFNDLDFENLYKVYLDIYNKFK